MSHFYYRKIKTLNGIKIIQVSCGDYHSLALSKGKKGFFDLLLAFNVLGFTLMHLEVFNSPDFRRDVVFICFFHFLCSYYTLSIA